MGTFKLLSARNHKIYNRRKTHSLHRVAEVSLLKILTTLSLFRTQRKKGVVTTEEDECAGLEIMMNLRTKNNYCKVDSFDVEHFFGRACLKQRNRHQSLSATQAVWTRTAQVEPWGTLRPIPWQSVALPFPRQVSPGSSLPTHEGKGSLYVFFAFHLHPEAWRWPPQANLEWFKACRLFHRRWGQKNWAGPDSAPAQRSRMEKIKRPKTKMNSAHQAIWTLTRATISASVCLRTSVSLAQRVLQIS